MRRFLGFFVNRHLLVNLIAAAMVILGYVAATSVQREFIPSFITPIVWVTAQLPGASARDVETKITIPLEEALEELEGVEDYTTIISDNTSFTTVEFYDDYNDQQLEAGELDLRAAVDSITDFPPEMEDEPTLLQFNPARATVIEVTLQGPEPALSHTAEKLESQIERLNSISSVDAVGLPDPEIRILVNPTLAREYGLTLTDIIAKIDRRNVSSTGGILESSTDRRQVVMWSRFENPEDVADTILRFDQHGGQVRLSDIARIESGREDTSLAVHTNADRGIVLLANKRETADIINTAQAVRELVTGYELPEGITAGLSNDESFIVANRLELIAVNGGIGAVLVAIILFIFIRPQPAIWILIGIPVVFLGTLALFGQLNLSLNLMSLTGFIIVLGMVVDDAVVVSERIVFKQSQGLEPRKAAIEGAAEMMSPVVAAALTTMLAFAPLMAVGGLPGKIVWQIPLVVVIALFFSLIESFCILPAHMSTTRNKSVVHKRAFMIKLEKSYRRTLQKILSNRLVSLLVSFSILLAIMMIIRPLVPFILFPQDDADRLFVKITAPLGTPLEQTEAITSDIERQLLKIAGPDLDVISSRIGHQNIDSLNKIYGEAENEAIVVMQFKPLDRTRTNVEWIEHIHSYLVLPQNIQAVYQSEYFGPPTDQPVTVHVLSNNDKDRRRAAYEVESYLRSIPGVIEIQVDERPGTPQLDLNIDYQKLAQLGLDPQDVATTLTAAFYGIEASEHRDLDHTTALRVQFDPSARTDLSALLETPVRNREGKLIRLRSIVAPQQLPAVSRIHHRSGMRSATIRASFASNSGLTAQPFGKKMQRELFPRFSDIADLYIYNGGEAVETEKTTGQLAIAATLAVLSIAVVIWLMLGSLLEAVFVLMVIPFAVAGVFFTFFVHGMPMSMFSMMGTVGLAGVVVNASIVMVDSIHRRVKDALVSSANDSNNALLDAVVERLRPILVTTLTTLGGVLPTAYGIGGYDPVVSPMSLAIGWGLVFSTLVTLFVVPVLYSLAKDIKQFIRAHNYFQQTAD